MAVHRGNTEFEAGGEALQLRFSMNAMVRFQEKFDTPFMEALEICRENPTDFRTLRGLFWAGLGNKTVDEAGDIMDILGLHEAAEIVGRAISAAFPSVTPDSDAGGNAETLRGNARGKPKTAT